LASNCIIEGLGIKVPPPAPFVKARRPAGWQGSAFCSRLLVFPSNSNVFTSIVVSEKFFGFFGFKSQPLSAAGYSAVFIPSRSDSTLSLNCFSIRFVFRKKNRFRATSQLLPPRTRVARNPSAKNYRFCFGLPPFRRQRRAERNGCAAVGRFSSLPCPLSRFPFFHIFVSD
jgi:hypothetical protein